MNAIGDVATEERAKPSGGFPLVPVLAVALLLAGLGRGTGFSATSDQVLQLARVGTDLLLGSGSVYTDPPGADRAPFLGALITAIGAGFAPTPQLAGRPSGSVLLALTLATLFLLVTRRFGRGAGLLAAAFVFLPPGFASSFVLNPSAATGGLLLTLAIGLSGRWPTWAGIFAWTALLTTPVAWLTALPFQFTQAQRKSVGSWVAGAIVLGIIALGEELLPGDARGKFLQSLWGGASLAFDGLPSTGRTLSRLWFGGTVLALPAVLIFAVRTVRPVAEVHWVWGSAILGMLLLAGPGDFLAETAVLAPLTGWALAASVAQIRDPNASSKIARPLLIAALLPVALLAATSTSERRERRDEWSRTARSSQIAQFLLEENVPEGAIMATRVGALGLYSEREVRPMRPESLLEDPRPEIVVFKNGLLPAGAMEEKTFLEPAFLGEYIPTHVHRGPTRSLPDVLWIRRKEEARVAVTTQFARELLDTEELVAFSGVEPNRETYRDLVDRAPPGFGIAHEWWAHHLAAVDSVVSRSYLRQASRLDPATATGHGRVAEEITASGRVGEADSLLARTLEFHPYRSDLWAARARIRALGGDFEAALKYSERAIRLQPTDARLLTNHGILLWATRKNELARQFWRRAAQLDEETFRFLGDFESAPDHLKTPPLAPFFTEKTFKNWVERLEESAGRADH